MPDTPKTNLFNIKTSKKTNPKDTICHAQKQPTIFHKFSVFFNIQFLFLKKLCFAENTIKIVFSGKHSFSKTHLVKPTFSPMSKKHLFPKKGVIFAFGQFPLKPLFLQFFLVYTVLGQKIFLANTDSVHENARFFSLPDTNSVSQFLLKIHFFDFSHFCMTTLKNPIFIGFFGLFHFLFFFSFFCF